MSVAFVLGNGRSRMGLDLDLMTRYGPIYACNAIYREYRPAVLVATDRPIAEAIQHSGYSAQYRFHTRKPIPGLGAQPVPHQYHGYSSGPLAVSLAALDGHDPIYLVGFDLGGLPGELFNNVYADTEFYKKSSARPTYTGNWVRQICALSKDFPGVRLLRVMGESSAPIAQFDGLKNFYTLTIAEFGSRLNTSKDL